MSNLFKPEFGSLPHDTPEREGLVLDLAMLGRIDLDDYSNNENNGTNNSATHADGQYGPALFFNGSSDYVDLDSSLQVTEGSPFSILIKVKNTTATEFLYTVKSDGTSAFELFFLDNAAYEPFTFGSAATSGWGTFRPSGGGLLFGEWIDIAVTYNGGDKSLIGSFKCYIDGSEVVLTTSSAVATIGNVSRLGRLGTSSNYFTGDISTFSIYNYDLSAQQIKSLYDNPWQAWERNNIAIWTAAQGGVTPTGSVNLLDGLFERKRLVG